MQRKEPFPRKIFTPCVPERRFAGLFGCIARISCQSQLILNTRRQYAATNWRFSRPKPLLGCVERKTCHGLPPGNAFREHFAIGKRPGTHRGEILPRQGTRERTAAESCRGKALGNASREDIATASQAKGASGRNPATVGRWETHFASILPSSSARERIAREYCHCQSPENAFAKILPWTSAWIRPHQITAALPAKKRRRRQDLENAPVRSTKDRVLARLG